MNTEDEQQLIHGFFLLPPSLQRLVCFLQQKLLDAILLPRLVQDHVERLLTSSPAFFSMSGLDLSKNDDVLIARPSAAGDEVSSRILPICQWQGHPAFLTHWTGLSSLPIDCAAHFWRSLFTKLLDLTRLPVHIRSTGTRVGPLQYIAILVLPGNANNDAERNPETKVLLFPPEPPYKPGRLWLYELVNASKAVPLEQGICEMMYRAEVDTRRNALPLIRIRLFHGRYLSDSNNPGGDDSNHKPTLSELFLPYYSKARFPYPHDESHLGLETENGDPSSYLDFLLQSPLYSHTWIVLPGALELLLTAKKKF